MHVIICGLGQVGYRVLEEFIRLKQEVVVVSTVIKKEHEKLILDNNVKVVPGDARDHDVLVKAGIAAAKAIIALTKKDIENVEISLKAKSINPDISTIVRIYDELLASKIESGFGIERAFCTPAIAAAGYVASVLSDKLCEYIRFGKENVFLFEWDITNQSTLLDKTVEECRTYLGIEPVFVKNSDEKPEMPKSSYRFKIGDRILFFSTNIKLLKKTAKKTETGQVAENTTVSPLMDKTGEAVLNFSRLVKNIPAAIKILIALFSIFLLTSVWVFHKAMGWSIIDSFYFVLTTSATVGYGDFNLKEASPLIKIFGCLVIISGPALIACLFSVIAEVIVSNKLNQYFGLGRVKYKDHIVVAGLGSLGYRVANCLYSVGEKVIAIERKAESESLAIMKGKIPVITGDARNIQVLDRIGIDRARALVAVTDDDMVNLGIALHAKEINPAIKTVIRVFDKEFGQRIKENYGIDSVLCASQLVASTFAAGLIHKNIQKSFWWNDMHVVILIKRIGRKSFLCGLSKQDIIDRYGIVPVLCNNKRGYNNVDNSYIFTKGDQVVLVSDYESINKLNS